MVSARSSSNSSGPLLDLILDRAHLADVRILAGEQFAPLVNRFCDDAAAQIEAMRNAARGDNIEMLRRGAHKLRGSGLIIGARALAHSCGELENKIHRGQLANAQAEVELVAARYAEVAKLLLQFSSAT